MKKIIIFWIMMYLAACSKVPAGHVGVKVYLLGSDKGVEQEELGVGRYWIGVNEELYIFPTYLQNYVWTKTVDEGSPTDESFTFQTKEGLPVNADIGISYSVKPNKVTEVFQKYRRGIDEITDTFLRNQVRDALVTVASTKPIEFIYGEGKAEMIKKVQEIVKEQNQEYFDIQQIYWIGELRLPPQVTDAINSKITASQDAMRVENQIQQSKAEALKNIEQAKGEAESVRLRAEAEANAIKLKAQALSSSPQLIQYEMIQKWDGKLPVTTLGKEIPFLMNMN